MTINIFKSFSSFLNGDNQDDKSLNQGKELLEYESIYKKQVIPHLKPLQMTSSPNLSSIIETLESNSSLKDKQQASNEKISKTETLFNQTLSEYSATYKTLIESLMNISQNKDAITKYYGKVVKDKDGYFIYVNDYGFTHKYLADTWSYNDSSCPNTYTKIENDTLSKLKVGPNMGSGQACKIAGQNVQNSKTNEVAWIDIKGFKHIYTSDIWQNKKSSCNINPIILSSKAYNNIPNGTPMENNTNCLKLDIDPQLWTKLQDLKNKLIYLADELSEELDNIQTTDNNINEKLKEKKKQLDEYIKQLNQYENSIYLKKNHYKDIQGQEIFSNSYVKSNEYQQTIWLILTILIMLGLFRTLVNADDVIVSTILIVVLIFVLFFIMKTYYS